MVVWSRSWSEGEGHDLGQSHIYLVTFNVVSRSWSDLVQIAQNKVRKSLKKKLRVESGLYQRSSQFLSQ